MPSPATFSSLGVPADLVDALGARGIAEAFPIQAATLPDGLAGRDVCGKAPTGSGKTIAFGIPLVVRVGRAAPRRPKGLVLAPTRELAAQIAKELELLATGRDCRVATFYGGVGFGSQLEALRRGVDVAVACPGRLEDLLAQGALRLDDVHVAVVDEADRMADMGFLPAVRRILDKVSPDRQTMLFSATLDGDVGQLVRRYQRDPRTHELEGDEADLGGDLEHLFWAADRTERVRLTARIVLAHGSAMVFCRTRRGVDRVTRQLAQAGVAAAPIHGDRSQSQRDRALADFKEGAVRALVGTDVAARGIHVEGVGCVVHFDPPEDEKTYVHRSGRTGRGGASGTVISLVAPEHAEAVRDLQARLGFERSLATPDTGRMVAPDVLRAPQAPPAPAAVSPAPRPRTHLVHGADPQGAARPRGQAHGPAGRRRTGTGSGAGASSGGAPSGGRRPGPRRSQAPGGRSSGGSPNR